MPEFYFVPKKLARKVPRLISLVHKIEGLAFRGIFWVIRRLSLEQAMKLSGGIFYRLGYRSDKAAKARANLAIAFANESPAWREKTAREIFRYLGYSAVELIKLDQIWADKDNTVEFVVEPLAKEHLLSKAPTVFITAHVGPWQVTPLITREFNYSSSTIYAPESNPIMNDLMLDLRKELGDGLISAKAGPRPIIRELKNGNSVGIVLDTRPETGKMIPFFGKDALSNTSAVGLALRSNATIVLVRGERLPNARFRITALNPIVSPDPQAPVKEQAEAITAIVHQHFEHWITDNPDQWICLKRRWPKANKL